MDRLDLNSPVVPNAVAACLAAFVIPADTVNSGRGSIELRKAIASSTAITPSSVCKPVGLPGSLNIFPSKNGLRSLANKLAYPFGSFLALLISLDNLVSSTLNNIELSDTVTAAVDGLEEEVLELEFKLELAAELEVAVDAEVELVALEGEVVVARLGDEVEVALEGTEVVEVAVLGVGFSL